MLYNVEKLLFLDHFYKNDRIIIKKNKQKKMSVTIVYGNLLEAEEEYIAHQCNCVTTYAKFLAKSIFDKYPYADSYSVRAKNNSVPGTIEMFGSNNQKKIINMYAQYYPGKSKYSNDIKALRLQWFKNCLNIIASSGIKFVAMPYNIGCGAAGGNWEEYYNALVELIVVHPIDIKIYKLK